MSIRTPFNPLGTLGGREIDFVQPVMTGPDTWQTPLAEGSCGMVVNVTTSAAPQVDWRVLNTRRFFGSKGNDTITLDITFDKPVQLTAVRDYGRTDHGEGGYNGGTSKMQVIRTGETVTEEVTYSSNTVGEALITAPTWSRTYRIIVVSTAGSWRSYGKFELIGKIRP